MSAAALEHPGGAAPVAEPVGASLLATAPPRVAGRPAPALPFGDPALALSGDGRISSGSAQRPANRARGFTLLEVLLALSLLAAILGAFSLMIYSMAETWRGSERKRLLARHAHAVTDHLEDMLRRAVRSASASGANTSVAPAEVKLPNGATALLLTFELPGGDRLLPWPEQPLPDVVCSLANDDRDGLVLYWHSRAELDFDDQPPRKLPLSRIARITGYDYFDENLQSWRQIEEITPPAAGDPPQPARIHLKFTGADGTVETAINVPALAAGLPSY